MLNKSERFKVLQLLRAYCITGLFPTDVDLTRCKLKAPSIRKQWICAAYYRFHILHVLYKIGSLAYAYFLVPNIQLHYLIFHAIVAVGPAMAAYWYYEMFIKDPCLFTAYATATLTGNTGGLLDPKDNVEKKWTARLRKYSMQDLIAMSMPYMIVPLVPAMVAAYLYDPSMKLLLYAALPTNLQTWAAFGLCMVEEVRYLVMTAAIAIPTWQLQVIAFDLLCRQLKLLMQRTQNAMQSPRNTYRTLRRLQLFVSMLNAVNSNLIFTWKLFSITLCTVSGYAAIAHFGEHPVFGVMYVMLLIDGTFIYTVVYEKAFKIPELFGQAASSAELCAPRSRACVYRRQIMSIPRTKIRVGRFHQMERTSTLIFMDYVVNNIVSMLVAFR